MEFTAPPDCMLYLDLHFIRSVVSLPVPVLLQSEEWKYSGLTSSLSINYYVPASVGERLVVIATTKAVGKHSVTVHGEVRVIETRHNSTLSKTLIQFILSKMWSKKGLVASCTLIKMVPRAKL